MKEKPGILNDELRKKLTKGIDRRFWDRFVDAGSERHAYKIRSRILGELDGKSENRILLEEILNATKISKRQCSELLWDHQNSLDGYLYRFHGKTFPSSFAYFFLNSILHHTLSRKDVSPGIKFFETILDTIEIGGREKLIIPALEHHILMLVRSYIKFPSKKFEKKQPALSDSELDEIKKVLSKGKDITLFEIDQLINKYRNYALFWLYARENPTIKELGLFDLPDLKKTYMDTAKKSEEKTTYDHEYINETVPGALDYLDDPDIQKELGYKTEKEKFFQSQKIVDAIKNFKPVLEFFRKKHISNLTPPDQIANLEDDQETGIIFTKKFLRNKFNIRDEDEVALHRVQDNSMRPIFNKNDFVLIKKYPPLFEPLIDNLEDGLYAVKRNNEILIKRIIFGSVSLITSDAEKRYPPEKIKYVDLITNKMLYGKVLWSMSNHSDSNVDYEIPNFLQENKDRIKRWEDIYEEEKKIA